MVQFFERGPSRGALQASILGPALGQGLGEFTGQYYAGKAIDQVLNDPSLKNAPLSERQSRLASALRPFGERGQKYLQQQLDFEKQASLEQAFNKLKDLKGSDFLDKLAEISPALLGAGQGQALGEITPILAQSSRNDALLKALEESRKNKQTRQTPGRLKPQDKVIPQQIPTQEQGIPSNIPPDEAAFRYPQAPVSSETTFPQQTAVPEFQEEMTADDIEDLTMDIIRNSTYTNNPMDYGQALQTAQQTAQNIINQNDRVRKQQQDRKIAQQDIASKVVNRAADSGYLKHPESRTIAEKLALDAKDAPNETEAWEKYVKPKLIEVDNALSSIKRSSDVSGPFTKIFRQGMGTYKNQENIIEDLQPDIKVFKKYGLYNELRNVLMEDVGLGTEMAERAIFPFEGTAKQSLEKFPIINEKYQPRLGFQEMENLFPGDKFKLPPDKFNKFKENLGQYLNENPGVNLVALRGALNQDKRYAWQDISTAISQLIADEIFKPDAVQQQQRQLIKEPPMPGLSQQFNYIWKGTK